MEKIIFEAKVKKSETPISKVIQDLGIVYPNESLGFLHAIYAKADGVSPNKNGVILSKSVSSDVPKLRFTQVNKDHNRAGFVLGTILDSWINPETDEIEIVFSFFKSLYPQEWEVVEEAISKGDLNVSFELMVEKKDVEIVDGKYKLINHCDFDGVGLLFPGIVPAYSNARVLLSANEIVNKIFNKSKETVFASAKDVTNTMEQTSKQIEMLLNLNKEDIKVDKTSKDALLAIFKVDIQKELGEEATKNWTDEQYEAELQKRAASKVCPDCNTDIKDEEEMCAVCKDKKMKDKQMADEKAAQEKKDKEEAELKAQKEAEELKAKEEAEKAALVNHVTTETKVYDVIFNTEDGTEDIIETLVVEEVVDGKTVKNEKIIRHCVYPSQKVEAIKAEYETKLSEKDMRITSKDEEIKNLNNQIAEYKTKEFNEKVSAIRAELGDFVKDLSDEQLFDEDKIKIARLSKQVEELKIEKSEKIEVVAKVETEVLETGHEEETEADEHDKKIARKQVIKAAQNRVSKKK